MARDNSWLRSHCARRRRSKSVRLGRGPITFEPLEVRTLLTATPLGDALTLSTLADPATATVAATEDGALVVFQAEERIGVRQPGNDEEIFVQRLDADGVATGEPILVNGLTRGAQAEPAIAATAEGSFWVVWSGRGAGDRQGVFGQRFAADGTPNGDALRINQVVGGQQSRPAVALAADGTATVVWQGAGDTDAAGIWMQRFAADGSRLGDQVQVNTTTEGIQAYPSVGVDAEGNSVVAWSSRHEDGDAWGVFARRFDADGAAVGDPFAVNATTAGSQHEPVVAMADAGNFAVLWSSFGQDGSGWGVFSQRYDRDGTPIDSELAVNERTEGDQRDVDAVMADSGGFFATWNDQQPNGDGWEVRGRTFEPEGAPTGDDFRVSEANASTSPGNQQFPSVDIDDNGNALVLYSTVAATQRSDVVLGGQRLAVDIGPAENVAPQLANIRDQTASVGDTLVVAVTATDANRNDTLQFSLDDAVSPSSATITQTGENAAEIRWTPTAADRLTTVNFRVFVDDDAGAGDAVQFEVDVVNAIPEIDLNGDAAGIDTSAVFDLASGGVDLLDARLEIEDEDQTTLAGATVRLRPILDGSAEQLVVDVTGTSLTSSGYSPATGVLSLSGVASPSDYVQVLRTLRYENSAGTPNTTQRAVDLSVNDGAADSELATVTIDMNPNNDAPTLAALPDVELLAGSPLWIPLDGFDADGDALTYDVRSTDDFLVTPEVSTGNRSLRIEVENFGEMVFQLFEDRAPRATDQIISLAQDDFYDGIIFHRVIDDFVIQGGDPTGTGTGGSTLGDFDDQFDVDLQHNRTGLLSMAKSFDDTNDSQFFITEGPTRHLDFNHSIFGVLVEGEPVREAISEVAVGTADRPLTDVVMSNVEVFTDTENGAVLLFAPDGVTGTTEIFVTVSDGEGGSTTQSFDVTVVPDTVNGAPFLDDIPTIQANATGTTSVSITAQDVEGDPIVFLDQTSLTAAGQVVPVTAHPDLEYSVDANSGVISVTPRNGLTGTHQITIAVGATAGSASLDYQVVDVQIQ